MNAHILHVRKVDSTGFQTVSVDSPVVNIREGYKYHNLFEDVGVIINEQINVESVTSNLNVIVNRFGNTLQELFGHVTFVQLINNTFQKMSAANFEKLLNMTEFGWIKDKDNHQYTNVMVINLEEEMENEQNWK